MLPIIFISVLTALFVVLKVRLELFRKNLKVGDKVVVHFSKTQVVERKVLKITTLYRTNFRKNKKSYKVKIAQAVLVKSFNNLNEEMVTLDKIYQVSNIDNVFYRKGNS